MPGLFSRRRGSSAQPSVTRSTTSAATTAASQAFINQSRTASLSSSAAAAALRSHTSSPEPVGNLVTKRMVRRGSTSSSTANYGRTASLQARGGLQRTNSSGSMTERTFRSVSPSPNRAATMSSATPTANARPPVPSIPKTLRSGHRAGSTEPPARVFSPTPARAGRSASVDQSGLKLQQNNRASLNFSRPRVASPEPPSQFKQQANQPQINNSGGAGKTAQASASTGNKKVHTSGGWFAGPVGAASTSKPPPIQTSTDDTEEVMVYDANSRTFVRSTRPKPKVEPPSPIKTTLPALKPGDYDPATRRIVPHPQPTPAEKPAEARPATLHKQPSVVAEEPEAERAAEESAKVHGRSMSLDVPNDRGRGGSLSPSRNARFSASPIVTNVLHEPPQRGLSPVKSALKHSPSSSVRTASPVTTFSPATQDLSDTTSQTSADGSATGKKRKSVRISFEPPVEPPTKEDSEDEVDDYSKPRPVLPSFGSVRRRDNDPLPPQVTSKDAADQSDGEGQEVPAISLHPPTPGIDEAPRELATDDESNGVSDSQELRGLAQGIIRYGDESDSSAQEIRPQHISKASDSSTQETRPQHVVKASDSSTQETRPQHMRKASDADVYSDAPETQDGGFASLDAIVESPVSSPVKKPATSQPTAATATSHTDSVQSEAPLSATTLPATTEAGVQLDGVLPGTAQTDTQPASPTATSTAEATSTSQTTAGAESTQPDTAPDTTKPVDWSATSAHWNQVNAHAQLSGDEKKSKLSFFKRNKKKDRPSSPESPTSPTRQSTRPDSPRQPVNAVAEEAKPAQADDNKATQPDPTPAKSAQPSPAVLTKRQSVQAPAKRHSVQPIKTMQPLKSALKTPTTPADGFPKTMRGNATPASPTGPRRFSYTPTPASKLRHDSDSESSFKKKRRSKVDRPMRRSMRGSVDTRAAARPMSPVSDSGRSMSMRTSLRGPAPKAKPKASAFKSRLANSDSEDEPRPAYQSRFVDSDDDDTILEELPPVRGIPKRKGQEDGDSTDLEDESDAEGTKLVINPADVDKAMEIARKKLGLTEQRDRDQDKVLISDVMSDAGSESTAKRRRSFVRGILSRNRHSSNSVARHSSPPPPMPRPKRGDSSVSAATAPVRTEDWPLPPPVPTDRPRTSGDGHTPVDRPQNRRSFSARVGFTDEAIAHSEKAGSADAVFSQRTGRKKKFALLRKAFGLYD